LISAEPGAIDRGIPLLTVTEPSQTAAASAAQAAAKRKTPPTAGLKFWDERTQRVVELVPQAPMRNLAWGFRAFHKNLSAAALPVATACDLGSGAVLLFRGDSDELRLSFSSSPVSH
jgi:hypothetical protein